MMMRKLRVQDAGEKPCIKPKPFLFLLDKTSTIPYFDSLGRPKLYAPSTQLPNGEWSYCLSPYRNDPPLRDERLTAHLAELSALQALRNLS